MAIDIGAAKTRRPASAPEAQPHSWTTLRVGWTGGGDGRVSGKDLIDFTTQLSLMLEVGTSLTDAARALENQTASPVMQDALRAMCKEMEEGQSFSVALSRHPKLFDGVFVSMIRAGETGGYLRDALDRIAEMLEKREALLAHIRSTLAYPLILGVMSMVVVVFVLTGVLPKFTPLFEGKEHILPLSTRVLLAISHSLRSFWLLYILGIGGLVAGLKAFFISAPGRALKDRMAVSLPVIGPLTNKIYTGQLLRTLGHLLESHVALTDALAVTRMTLQNRFYSRLIDQVEEIVRGGGRLARAFMAFPYMPGSVRQMIATGEDAGNLYPVMLRLARHYDTEVEQELKKVAALIEPAALIILGTIVGVIVASVILPLFKLAHAIN